MGHDIGNSRTRRPAWTRALVRRAAGMLLGGHLLLAGSPAAAQAELIFASTLPESSPIVEQVFRPWVDDLNEAGAGVISVRLENGPTIANHTNVFERVNSGIVDMGWSILASTGTPFPRVSVAGLPFLIEDSKTGSAALWSVYRSGLLDADFENAKVITLVALPPFGLHSTAPIATLEDLAGVKVRAADRISAEMLSALGATPVSLAPTESYQAVEKGVVGAIFVNWTGVTLFRLDEVAHEHLETALASGPAAVFVNQGTYDSLSDEARTVLDEAGIDLIGRLSGWFSEMDDRFGERVRALPGHTTRTLPDAEKLRWQELTDPIIDAWIAETPDGRAILDAFRAAQAAQAA